jgi:hypothetical protein
MLVEGQILSTRFYELFPPRMHPQANLPADTVPSSRRVRLPDRLWFCHKPAAGGKLAMVPDGTEENAQDNKGVV